jgi:16S rRNA (guanine966-N2)-methyltransferase
MALSPDTIMRIIKGRFHGRRIVTPKGFITRPTPEVVREALFNILGNKVLGATFVDLFAGSGGMGLEAISRDADQAIFVETGREALRVLKRNIETFDCRDNAWVLKADAYRRMAPLVGSSFNIIFASPPYDNLNLGAILMNVSRTHLLADDGVLIIQQPTEEAVIPTLKDLVSFDQRRYGRNMLVFYEKDISVARPGEDDDER